MKRLQDASGHETRVGSEISGFEALQGVQRDLADRPKRVIQVRRDHVFEDLVEVYQDPSITENQIFVKLEGETGIDVNGVSREVLTLFWMHFRTHFCSGHTEFVPTINPKWFLSANLPVVLGRILHHGFVLQGLFPTFLCKATVMCLLTGEEPTEDVLLTSFFNFLPQNERGILQEALEGHLSKVQEQVLLIFCSFQFFKDSSPGHHSPPNSITGTYNSGCRTILHHC